MERIGHLIVMLVLMLSFATISIAQTTTLKAPPRRNFKYEGKIVSTFDETKDRTLVLIQLMPVKDVEDPRPVWENSADNPRQQDTLSLSMYFSYPGKTFSTPEFVSIGMVYMALEPQKYEGHLLSAKLDGARVELGKMSVMSRRSVIVRFAYKRYTSEVLELTIPYPQFLALANAKKVKLKLGEFEFDLSKDHLEAIRDLASRTVP